MDSSTPLTPRQERAIAYIRGGHTVLEAARLAGCSHGTVYAAMLKTGERRNEPKLQANAERKRSEQERLALLEAAVAKPGTVETMDTLQYLRTLESDTFQAAIFSPPFNVAKAYEHDPTGDQKPFAYFLGWMVMLIAECARCLKPGGTLVMHTGATKLPSGELEPMHVIFWKYLRMAGLTPQNLIAWPSEHSAFTPKMRRKPIVEYVMVASKGEPSVFNATPIRTKQKNPHKTGYKKERANYGQPTCNPLGAHPTDLLTIPHIRSNSIEKYDHPAQYATEFAENMVLAYTNPLDKVLDPVVGAGATMIACYRNGREFYGADAGYAAIRDERMREEIPQLVSILPGVNTDVSDIWNAPVAAIHLDAQLTLLGESA